RLCDRVEDAVRARVDASSRYPLPVAGVVCDVAVDEQLEEDLRSLPPMDSQRLCQERRDEQAAAVARPPFDVKLPHRCIDDRVAARSRTRAGHCEAMHRGAVSPRAPLRAPPSM